MSKGYKFLSNISDKQIKCVLRKRKLYSVMTNELDPDTVFLNYDNKIIGYYLISNEPNNRLSIDRFEIFADFEKRGHGTYMLNYITRQNPNRLIVAIPDNNRAKEFFVKRGFEIVELPQFEMFELHLNT
jgi:ribosomal protein S18 acetylase RimI-like enzyme